MKAIIKIEGMMCENCKSHVEKALNALPGLAAKVNLEKGTATVTSQIEITDDVLTQAVTEAGYKVLSIKSE